MKAWLLENIFSIITAIFGSGSFVAYIIERKKRKVELNQSEALALQTMQAAYDTFSKDMIDRLTDMRSEVEDLKKKIMNVTSQLQEEENKYNVLQKSYDTLKKAYDSLKKEFETYKKNHK